MARENHHVASYFPRSDCMQSRCISRWDKGGKVGEKLWGGENRNGRRAVKSERIQRSRRAPSGEEALLSRQLVVKIMSLTFAAQYIISYDYRSYLGTDWHLQRGSRLRPHCNICFVLHRKQFCEKMQAMRSAHETLCCFPPRHAVWLNTSTNFLLCSFSIFSFLVSPHLSFMVDTTVPIALTSNYATTHHHGIHPRNSFITPCSLRNCNNRH